MSNMNLDDTLNKGECRGGLWHPVPNVAPQSMTSGAPVQTLWAFGHNDLRMAQAEDVRALALHSGCPDGIVAASGQAHCLGPLSGD